MSRGNKYSHLNHKKPIMNPYLVTQYELDKYDEMINIREQMSWGSAEQGIPQLSENEIILLNMVTKLLKEVGRE